MIAAVGVDVSQVSRMRDAIKRWGMRFLRKVFTEAEIAFCEQRANKHQSYAARFAAKEAVSKCLGTGFRRGVTPAMIEIVDTEHSRPTVRLHGRAAEVGGRRRIHLSLSHEKDTVVAMAVMEEETNGRPTGPDFEK